MGAPYLRKNDPQEAKFIPLFHAWGDLLLSRHIAIISSDRWVTSLATRWTIQSAWSCFELVCHLSLGLDKTIKGQQLSPGFWPNLNTRLGQQNPPVPRIDHKQPPWDDWHLIQEERHPYAHYGAGGGRFPSVADAKLAVDEAEKAIQRFLALLHIPNPRWLTASGPWPESTTLMNAALGRRGGASFGTPTIVTQGSSPDDPTTIVMAIIHLDGSEAPHYFPASYDWKPRFDQQLETLASPIKGIKVYDAAQVYLDEPLVMWGGEG